jgi:hypothetical protein
LLLAGGFLRWAAVRVVFAAVDFLLAFFALVAFARVPLRLLAVLAALLFLATDFFLDCFFVADFLADFRFFMVVPRRGF